MTESASSNSTRIGVQRVYLKGASLETPMGAVAFFSDNFSNLTINIEFNVSSTAIKGEAPNLYESVLRATLTATQNDKTAYVLEIDFAAIFEIVNAAGPQLAEILEVACPHYLLPYLRVQISDFLNRASLPVFHMPDVNWAEMRSQRLAANGANAPSTPQLH